MKHLIVPRSAALFKPLLATRQLQAAMMVLRPGQCSSDEQENEHPKAEQWLYVISGTGTARVKGQVFKVKEGSLLVVERREKHQIQNTGRKALVTLNFYSPPAYTAEGDVKPAVT